MTLDTRFAQFAVLHESDSGTLETCCDVRHSVAIGGKPDMSRTTHFGSEWTQSGHRVILQIYFI